MWKPATTKPLGFLVATVLLALMGCAEPTGRVTGSVTYLRRPVTTGSIGFNMKGKGIAQEAKLDAGGKFVMPEPLPAGTYHVYYVPPTPEPHDPAQGPPPAVLSVVPKKHQDLQNSNLSVEVNRGKNDIPIVFND